MLAMIINMTADKPFNALLGETFEFVDTKRGVRAVIEQVSVKPRVAAMQAESKEWCLWSHMGQVNRFWGKSLEMTNTGRMYVAEQFLNNAVLNSF